MRGASVIIALAQFDKRTGQGKRAFDWTFVDEQMAPWVARDQAVNLLDWPGVQKACQLFPEAESATLEYIMNIPNITYSCLDSSGAQGGGSQGIPLPKFWEPEVYLKYAQALKQFIMRYQDHLNPANCATTHDNYCMNTFVSLFEGTMILPSSTGMLFTARNTAAP